MVASKSALVAFIFTGDADELDHLAGVRPDDMAAEHPVGLAVDHQLQEGCGYLRPPPASIFIGRKRGLVDVDAGEAARTPPPR